MNVDIIQVRQNYPSDSNLVSSNNKRSKLGVIKSNLENSLGVQTIIKFKLVKKYLRVLLESLDGDKG